jgi:putative membrane-bound dehydrogenase-like protein
MKRLLCFAASLSMAFVVSAESTSPLSVSEALASFQLEAGLRIELVAAEPLVVDPVAMAFDESGRLFVVENRGYPTGPGDGKPPVGIVASLEDTDQDGRYDKRRVFAEALTFPNGIMPWRGGFVVTCAPDILYLKDSDGDGRADQRRVLLTGFDASNTTQLRVSHPTLGPDNWVYVTSGLTSGKITRPGASDAAPIETRTDVRFRPDTWEFEPCDGRGQFGQSFDDFGHRFVCMNRIHIQHVVFPPSLRNRNRKLNLSEAVQNVPETMVPEPLPGHQSAARIYPISRNITTADSHAGTFTAACGVTIYRGTGLPEEYYGNVFACDPTGNLVHRDKLEAVGATFQASRFTNRQEMVASTDDCFRPVNLALGPDGALYICDMYRKTIEHPQYLPNEVRKHADVEAGKDRGRIYRLVSTNHLSKAAKVNLARASVEELCQLLSHANGWQRDTAHRLLLEKFDATMAGPLKQLLTAQVDSSAAGRVFALHLLEQISALDEATLLRALEDFHPGVRETALLLASSRWQSSPIIRERVLELADNPDSHVRFHTALVLAEAPADNLLPVLARIAVSPESDKWTHAAVLSAISGREMEFARTFAELMRRFLSTRSTPPAMFALSHEVGRIIGTTQNTNQIESVLQELLGQNQPGVLPWQFPFLSGFFDAVEKRGVSPSLSGLKQTSPNSVTSRAAAIEQRARSICLEKTAVVELRQAAAELLARLGGPANRTTVLQMLDPKQPTALQATAARALVRFGTEKDAADLFTSERWAHFTPTVREAILEAMLSNSRRVPTLLSAIESGSLPAGVVNSTRRKQLLQHRDEGIRQRAAALYKSAGSTDRMKVFEECKSVLSLQPAPANGREVFKKNCATCHRLDREGAPVGPDLFGIRNQSKETILLHIIVPEYEILPGFVNYLIETKDGRSLSGIIAAETPQALILRKALNEEETIARSNIVSFTSSGISMMPQELEKTMTKQELADLLAYLKGEQ